MTAGEWLARQAEQAQSTRWQRSVRRTLPTDQPDVQSTVACPNPKPSSACEVHLVFSFTRFQLTLCASLAALCLCLCVVFVVSVRA